MKVKELFTLLQTLDPEKDVALFWDGASRGGVEGVVNDGDAVVLVGDWSIYRDGHYRAFQEENIIFG